MLELCGALAVAGDHGPVVIPQVPFDGAEGQHGLDRENHALTDLGVVGGCRIVVGDDEARVELTTHTVTGVVANHTVTETCRILLNDATNHVDLAARLHSLNRTVQGLFGALNQQAGLFVHVADEQGLVGVAVHAVQVCGDVQVEDVAVLQHGGVRDAVADDLVQGGAHGLGVAAVIHGGGVRAVVANVLVDQHVNLVGGGAGYANLGCFNDGACRDLAGCANPLNFLGGVHVRVVTLVGGGLTHVLGANNVRGDRAHGGDASGGQTTLGCSTGLCRKIVRSIRFG